LHTSLFLSMNGYYAIKLKVICALQKCSQLALQSQRRTPSA
jgi:hypothetical protein